MTRKRHEAPYKEKKEDDESENIGLKSCEREKITELRKNFK
jgi:hypothetical protein